jgi:hypothetical protein
MSSNFVLAGAESFVTSNMVRIEARPYSVKLDGISVKQITAHRVSSQADAPFYQLQANVGGAIETTTCMSFDASANEVDTALNALSVVGSGGVYDTKR